MQDLVEISISLPHVSNSLPVILTQNPNEVNLSAMLLETVHESQPVCSSINNFKMSLLSSNMTWYSSLDYTSCNWTFNAWFPLDHLVQCKANITLSNFQMTANLYVVDFYIDLNQEIKVSAVHTLTSELMYSAVNPCLPAPIYYHPEVHGTVMERSYAYPIATTNMIYYYYTVVQSGSPDFDQSRDQLLLLIFNSTARKSAWKLLSDESVSTLDIILQEYDSANRTISAPFKLVLQFHDNFCIPILKYDSVIHMKNNSSSDSEFKIGTKYINILSFIILQTCSSL